MKVFLDSSFIIELLKNNPKAVEIGNELIKLQDISFYINSIVFSEVTYQLYFKRKIKLEVILQILQEFDSLDTSKVEKLAANYIEKHNLRPNDALILATCKHYNIPYLVSLDEDFKEPCKKENITLINSIEE